MKRFRARSACGKGFLRLDYVYLLFLIIGMALLGASWAVALTIQGSAHDLSALTGGGGPSGIRAQTEDQVCVFCHTPHTANPVAPLWNRNLSIHVYSAAELPSAASGWTYLISTPAQPDGDSRLCLGCHDGTVAIGQVLNLGGMPATIAMLNVGAGGVMPGSASANLGTDLSGTHPISIPYIDALVADKAGTGPSGCETTLNPWKLAPVAVVDASPLELRPTNNTYNLQGGNGVQCTTCHDPHDPGATGFFLRLGSSAPDMGPNDPAVEIDALCTTCHVPCLP